MDLSPQDLLLKAKQGDTEAFGRLYELYFTPVFRYIYLRVREQETAEDIAQQVFLKVFKVIGDYQEKGRPLALFFTVARNKIIDHWRKKREARLDEADSLDAFPAEDENLAEKIDGASAGKFLEKTLAVLGEEQREVIILKYVSELSNKEIAALTGKKEEAIRQMQCRALKKVREEMKIQGKK